MSIDGSLGKVSCLKISSGEKIASWLCLPYMASAQGQPQKTSALVENEGLMSIDGSSGKLSGVKISSWLSPICNSIRVSPGDLVLRGQSDSVMVEGSSRVYA